jgi:hypothetical protein
MADADTANGTLSLAITPQNPTLYSQLMAANNRSDFPYAFVASNISSLNATYQVVLQTNLFASRPSHVNFTAVAFDADSLLGESVVQQRFRTFSIPVVPRPRITATLNSTATFLASARPPVFFTGVGLTDNDMIKLVNFGETCNSTGNSSLQTLTSVRELSRAGEQRH